MLIPSLQQSNISHQSTSPVGYNLRVLSAIFLGLDCGGSSSRAVALDDEGHLLHQGQSGSANLASTPMFRLRQNLSHATRGCPVPNYVCGCFAGLLTSEDRGRAISLLGEFFPDAVVNAEPDYAAAFFASEPGTDICVIAGTGSLVCSWSGTSMVKTGGRGYLLGDEGSAFQYGRDALLAYFMNSDVASTPLKKCVIDLFEAEDEATIISRLYRSPSPQAAVAKLAKPLAADAKAGKDYAIASISKNAALLAEVVKKHIGKHLPWKKEINVSLSGGLWKTSSVFVDGLAASLANCGIEFRMERIKTPPVYGAARLAKEMAIGH
jgi:N-acetylglucosamine kinase-like BadF-type ATPase